ncbi:dynein regulatory complex protein 10 isoform X2 [Lates calcarifer]|uniref:Dynein regulatory complex protein 10 n=1 Tax=Lates calcarifer TaxID=8187 RepID=A0AAJ7PGV0_LATCA|nr:dynein regulatory complex protein 10 isoform X2 [Lates calcarifer]
MQLTVNNIKGLQTAPVQTCMSAKRATVLAKKKAKTRSEDALRNHDTPQKRLLSVDAQRLSRILENCISQIEIAVSLSAILRLKSVSSVVDEELSGALQEHQLLSERLETLEGVKQESEGEDGESRKSARAQLERDVMNSVRDLLRLFRAHPDAISGLRAELDMQVGESELKLIRGLKMFHGHIVEKLLTSPDEELQLILYRPTSPSPADELKVIAKEEEVVAKSKKEKDEMIAQKKINIENMQRYMQGANVEVASMSQMADKQCQSHVNISKKQASMQQEIDRLNLQLKNLMLENRQTERALQEKNEKVETEIEYLIKNFDDEMEEKQADLELNENDYEMEEEQLRSLEKPFSVLEVEYKQIQEKRRLAEEKRQKEMKELELKTKAAIFAQAWWRGYSIRKALKNKGKSKKAKKGKGKKK